MTPQMTVKYNLYDTYNFRANSKELVYECISLTEKKIKCRLNYKIINACCASETLIDFFGGKNGRASKGFLPHYWMPQNWYLNF